MEKLPINCCCDAGRLIGFAPVPDGTIQRVRDGSRPGLGEDPPVWFELKNGEKLELPTGVVGYEHSEVASRGRWRWTHTAIKSMDTPIEKLREIPGWEENPGKDMPPGLNRSARNMELVSKRAPEARLSPQRMVLGALAQFLELGS